MAIDKIPVVGLDTGAPYWDSSGNVGIGTSSPGAKLAVTATSGVIGNFESTQSATNANLLNLNATQTNSSSGIRFQVNSGTTAQARIQVNGDSAIVFQQTSSDTERARIDSSGNLLVGTSSALGTLTVNGNISPVQAPSSNWGVDFAPSGSSGTFVTIANNGTYDIAAGSGMIWIMEESGASGFCQIACWYGSTAVVWQSASGYSVTVNTASKINIYFAPTTPNKYRIQNTTGSSKSIWISTIKMRLSV